MLNRWLRTTTRVLSLIVAGLIISACGGGGGTGSRSGSRRRRRRQHRRRRRVRRRRRRRRECRDPFLRLQYRGGGKRFGVPCERRMSRGQSVRRAAAHVAGHAHELQMPGATNGAGAACATTKPTSRPA